MEAGAVPRTSACRRPAVTAFVGSLAGTVLRRDGDALTELSLGRPRTVTDVFGLDASTLFALNGSEVLELEGVARRTNSAASGLIVNAVAHVDGVAVVGTSSGSLHARRALDDNRYAQVSTVAATGSITSIWSDGTHVAVGSQQLHYSTSGLEPSSYTTPAGVTWVKGIDGTVGDLYAVGASDVNNSSARIYHSTDPNGASWTTELSTGFALSDVWASADDVIAVGIGGRIVRRTSGGTWVDEDSGTFASLNGVWGASRDHVWAVGDSGTLLRYDGVSWRPITLPTGESLRAVDGRSATDVYVIGTSGVTFHFDGASWTPLSKAVSSRLNAVAVSPSEVVVATDLGQTVELLRTCAPSEVRCGDSTAPIRTAKTMCSASKAARVAARSRSPAKRR